MTEAQTSGWRTCSSCKNEIGFDRTYYVCAVSTCNRKPTDLRFCSIACWDAHVPVMRHRDAFAEERRAPTRAAWERQSAEEKPVPSPSFPRHPPAMPAPASPERPLELAEADPSLPRDVLVVASKLKAYVRARSGMNTAEAVLTVLSDRLRALCDEAIRNAARDGRKTVMDRDFR